MTKYVNDSKRIAQDALGHQRSEYGKYRMEILDDMIAGALSAAVDPTQQYPDRYLARYGALKQLKESFESDLESGIPTQQT